VSLSKAILATPNKTRPRKRNFINSISSLVPFAPRYPRLSMATRFPSERNFFGEPNHHGCLPVPPTVRFPTLMTVAFRRFCLNHCWQEPNTRTDPDTIQKREGHSRLCNSGGTFIARHRPDVSQSPPPLDPSLRVSQPPSGAPSRSFSSYAPDRQTIRSRRPRRLPALHLNCGPAETKREAISAKFSIEEPNTGIFPKAAGSRILWPPKIRASRRQMHRRLAHIAMQAHRCCRAGGRLRHRVW